MRNLICFFFVLYLVAPVSAQTPVFTFECFCGYVKPADNNCDVCDVRTTSRSFTGLLIRQNGTAFKWIESPYVVKVKGTVAEITELVYPNPEKIFIELRSTYCDSMPILLDSIACPCKPPPITLIAGPGITISGDTISAIDTSYTNELQTLDTFLRVGDTIKISLTLDDTTYFLLLPPGAAPQFIDTLQLVGNTLGISISGDGLPLKTLDLSQFMQTLTWTQSTGALSISGGNSITILGMVGASVSVNGEQGLVPKPLAGDQAKFLRGDGTWSNPSVGGDNWGSQVVQHGSTLTGNGTGASPLDVATDGITATHIAAGAVGTSEVADNSLTATDLAVNVVSSVDGVTNDGGDIDLVSGGIVTITPNDAANTITISATEVDGSVSNELQTFGHAGTTSYTNTLSAGGGSFTLQAAGIASISHSGGTVTITATETDGSTSNELQTISAAGAGPTSYTIDLSNGGGSVTLTEGSGIDLTRIGNTLTVANSGDLSASNELQTLSAAGTTSPTVTLSNSGGTITFAAAGIAAWSRSGNTLTLTATETDGSVSNELQTFGHAGTTSYTNTLSAGGGSFTLQAAGAASISHSGGTVTITATEVDGSTSNELQTISAGGAGPTSYTIDLSNGGGSVTFAEGAGIDLTRTGNTVTIANAGDLSASNELQTYGHAGTISYTNTLSAGGGSFSLQAAGIASISHSGGTVTITATETDGSTSNELQALSAGGAGPTSYTIDLSNGGGSVTLEEGAGIDMTRTGNTVTIASTATGTTNLTFSGASSPVTLNSSSGSDVTLTAGGIVSLAATSGNLTITATEVDGSTSNELQTFAHAGTTSYTNTLSAGGGSFTLQAAGAASISHSGGTVTITATETDGSVSNELQTLASGGTTSPTVTLSNGGGTITFAAAGIAGWSRTGNTLTLTATEVDGSTSNELQTFGHAGTTSYTNTLSAGGGSFTLQAAGAASISHSGGTVTITATEVDGSVSNELQTISAGGAGPSSFTVDLSNGGGAVTFSEGTGIDLTRSTNTITIASTVTGITDLTFSGASSPVTLNSSSGADVTLTAGGIVSLSATSGNVTITATEVDGSTSNELQTFGHAGTTSYTNTLSAGGGSFTLQAAGIAAISHSGGTVTITATETDGSVSNELQTLSAAGTTSPTVTLSNSGGTITFAAAGIAGWSRTGNTLTLTATEVDGSTSNELQTYGHAGTTSYTNTLSNAGGSFTLQAAGIAAISHTTGTVTITATEVDGSVSNELQSISASGAGPSSFTIDLSNGGGSVTLAEGAGIDLTRSTNTITIANSGDLSASNELQTYGHAGTTSYTNTLSAGGGSFTLQSGTNVTLSHSGGVVTINSSAGTVTGAESGTYLTGGKVRLGGSPLLTNTQINQAQFALEFLAGKRNFSRFGTSMALPVQGNVIRGLGSNPRTTFSTEDAVIQIQGQNAAATVVWPATINFGIDTIASRSWVQTRDLSNQLTNFPMLLHPRGGAIAVGRIFNPSAHFTVTATALTGSTATGRTMLLENLEGNGTVGCGYGTGGDQLQAETTWREADDAFRVTNRGTNNGFSSVRIAIGGEQDDRVVFARSSAASLVRSGFGYTNTTSLHSTVQSAGSFSAAVLETVGAPTFDETKNKVIYSGSTNITWTLPAASTCPGREYWLHHANSSGTITLSLSVSKGNGGTFNTISPGQFAHIFSTGSSWVGYKLTSL